MMLDLLDQGIQAVEVLLVLGDELLGPVLTASFSLSILSSSVVLGLC